MTWQSAKDPLSWRQDCTSSLTPQITSVRKSMPSDTRAAPFVFANWKSNRKKLETRLRSCSGRVGACALTSIGDCLGAPESPECRQRMAASSTVRARRCAHLTRLPLQYSRARPPRWPRRVAAPCPTAVRRAQRVFSHSGHQQPSPKARSCRRSAGQPATPTSRDETVASQRLCILLEFFSLRRRDHVC